MYPSGLESESESGNGSKPLGESQGKSVTFGMIKVCVSCVQVHLFTSVVCDVSLYVLNEMLHPKVTTRPVRKCYFILTQQIALFYADSALKSVQCRRRIFVICTSSVADPGFPSGGGANPPGGGMPTYDFAKFSQKLHEIERFLTPP